jgi:uncharacterized protein YndB with AHSA1/START domain
MSESNAVAEFRRTFVVPVPVEKAWQAFVDPRQREAWISPPGHDQLENPEAGFPGPGFQLLRVEIGEVDPHRRLTWSVERALPDGTGARIEVVVTFDTVAGGTRLTAIRAMAGQGESWELLEQLTRHGFDEEMTDLCAFLETGVNISRHFSSRGSIGARVRETPAGLRLARLVSGGFAADAGLREGDLLVSIGGAAVYARSDIALLEREHEAGEVLELSYVRDGVLHHGRGTLSEKHYSERAD